MQQFRIFDTKTIKSPLGHHTKTSVMQYSQIENEKNEMDSIPYASGVKSIMYEIVCSKPYLVYSISIVSQLIVNSGNVFRSFEVGVEISKLIFKWWF